METSQIYILISIIVLLIIAGLAFLSPNKTKSKKFSSLASIAFGFIIIDFFFEDNRFLGYGFFAIGIFTTHTN